MNKPEMITLYAQRNNMTKVDAAKEISNFTKFINDCVEMGETVILPNCMKIAVKTMPPRMARNPKTNETFMMGEKKKVVISPMNALKAKANK